MLFHMSEEPGIDVFVPRENAARQDLPPAVWAIDEEHLVHYLFPRDCPRIIYTKSPGLSPEDERSFFPHTSARTVIAVENRWLERIRSVVLYRYAFDSDDFYLFDEIAGYYLSHRTVTPKAVEPVDRLLDKIVSTGCELRFTPSLYPLRDAIVASTVNDFSIIRFRYAAKE